MSNSLFLSEIIYLTIPVQFESCFGEAWMYVLYIYFLQNNKELRSQIRHLRISINSIYIMALVLHCPIFLIIQTHAKQACKCMSFRWPKLKLYSASCLVYLCNNRAMCSIVYIKHVHCKAFWITFLITTL